MRKNKYIHGAAGYIQSGQLEIDRCVAEAQKIVDRKTDDERLEMRRKLEATVASMLEHRRNR